MNNKNTLAALSVLVMVGCGNDNDKPIDIETEVNDNGVPVLNEAKLSLKPLKSVQESSFETYFKNGIYLSTTTDNGIRYLDGGVTTTTADSSTEASAPQASSDKFSSTITQEDGVDEADRIKYDGDYLYVANNAAYYGSLKDENGNETAPESHPAHVRVLKRNADNSMAEVSTINVYDKEEYATISGIYLSDDTLSVLSSGFSYGIAADVTFDIWFPGPQTFNISLFDIESPESSTKTAEFDVEGYVISSRRVDNNLIVVSSFNPNLDGLKLDYAADTDEAKAANFAKIKDADVNSLLPSYTDKDGVEHNLVTADNCYIPEDATNKDGYHGIVTLTTINLDDPSQVNSVCVNSTTQGIYATPNSVYMYGSADHKQSVIHKFSVEGQNIDYKSTTNFDGHLFGRGQSQLRFSEDGDYLRLVSTEFTENSEDRFEHKLKVFNTESAGNSMELVAELPNDNNPAKIGKPNEDIYAVRYFGNKAFIVTFESIDPLYVINLEDNTSPVVESELEIVGYSSYLHPISENLILGIGQNVDPNRFQTFDAVLPVPSTSSTTNDVKDDEKIVEGAKIALFDVSGDAKLVKEFVFEGGYTPAEYNYHALTYLAKSENEHLFALPVETWSSTFDQERGYEVWSSKTELQLLDVTIDGAGGSLNHVGSVAPESDESRYYGSWDDRAIIHGDVIYYVHGRDVWQSLWSNPKSVVGPF